MRAIPFLLAPVAALTLCCGAATAADSARSRPPAPALQAGGLVTDSAGQVVGRIQSVGEDPSGEMFVIVNVDGRLVSIPEGRLKWNGRDAVADATKAQLTAVETGPQGRRQRR